MWLLGATVNGLTCIAKYNGIECNTDDSISALKRQGLPDSCHNLQRKGSVPLQNLIIQKGKFALFFGTELTGLIR